MRARQTKHVAHIQRQPKGQCGRKTCDVRSNFCWVKKKWSCMYEELDFLVHIMSNNRSFRKKASSLSRWMNSNLGTRFGGPITMTKTERASCESGKRCLTISYLSEFPGNFRLFNRSSLSVQKPHETKWFSI